VGVVGDAKYEDLHQPAPRTVYLNAFQEGRIASHFSLRTTVPPSKIAPAVRIAVREALPTVQVGKVTTLSDQLDASLVTERVLATLSGVFGALGALLAAIGLYGLLAYTVARRTNEIGIRMALGATRGAVTRIVVTDALRMVWAGLVLGTIAAVWSTRLAASLIENLTVEAPLRVVVAGAIMIAAALLAAYLPARRAARVSPIDALRHS
jgi:putative ABC transport system permease protein